MVRVKFLANLNANICQQDVKTSPRFILSLVNRVEQNQFEEHGEKGFPDT